MDPESGGCKGLDSGGGTLGTAIFRGTVLWLALWVSAPRAWDLFLSGSQGYTHYDAQDLNRILFLMEKTTKEKGFNPYKVSQFDGHPQNALVVGARKGHWSLGLEAEFWVEDFVQTEVPFDLENAERSYRITCDSLRDPGYTVKTLAGCVEAHETFNFLPITLQLTYDRDLNRFLRFGVGYGVGVLAGSAYISMSTQYFGEGHIPDDEIRFQVWPGVNVVQKAFFDAEFLPIRNVGLVWRSGLRFSRMQGFTLRQQTGSSRIFSSVFPDAREGANLYIQSFTQNPDDDKIFVGTEAIAKEKAAREPGSRFHLVNGDFTGWFVSLKLNLYWRDL